MGPVIILLLQLAACVAAGAPQVRRTSAAVGGAQQAARVRAALTSQCRAPRG